MDRLSAVDLSTMWPDEAGWPQDVGLLGALRGEGLTDTAGRVRLDAVRAAIRRHLPAAPRLRQVVRSTPPGLGRSVWVDDPDFRLGDHVRVREVPPPGDEGQLLATAEQIRRRPLDLARPLWQLWLLPGLTDGDVGVYLRAHHAMADGAALVALVGALLSVGPDEVTGEPPVWAPAPAPTAAELLADRVGACARSGAGAGRAVVRGCARPVRTARSLRTGIDAVLGALTAGRAPRTSLNRPVGPDRRTELVRTRLDDIRAAGHRHGATVNDVLLTAVAGGLRELLVGRGEPTDGVALRAVVPVSMRRDRTGPERGNALGQIVVPIPVGTMPSPERLELVSRAMTDAKRRVLPRWAPVLRSRRLRRGMMALAARQRSMNVYVTDVAGPRESLFLAGAPLTNAFAVIALMANLPLGVGAISYAGQLNITVTADPDACPDLNRFVAGLSATLDSLTGSDRGQAPPHPHPFAATGPLAP